MNNFIFKLTVVFFVITVPVLAYFSWQAYGETIIGKTLNSNPDLKRGLVGHWTFDGSDMLNNVADVSGNGNIGYLTNFSATTTVPGKIGQGLEFYGLSEYVDAGNVGSINSISFWMKTATTSYGMRIINIDGTDIIEIDEGSTISATSFPAATVYTDTSSAQTQIATSTWHHIVITDTSGVSASALELGRATAHYGGFLDDIRIYNRAISHEEIKRLYKLGATTKINTTITSNPNLTRGLIGHWTFDGPDMINNVADVSGQGNAGYLEGFSSTTTIPGKIGQGYEFHNTDGEIINLGDLNIVEGVSEFSVAVWVKTKSGTSDADDFFSQEGPGTDVFRLQWNAGEDIRFDVNDSAGTGYVAVYTNGIEDTRWHHIVGVKDGKEIRVYVDKVLGDTVDAMTDVTDTSTNAITIGNTSNGTSPANAIMDDVRIYNRALSHEEVKRIYDLGR